MEWFQLQSDSIGALTLLVLCLVITFYLFSIPNKSNDGKRITGLFILFILLHLLGFFADSVISIQAAKYLLLLQDCIISLVSIYTVWFIYKYRDNYAPKEMRQILILSALLFILALFFQPTSFKWTLVLYLFLSAWNFTVLSRKMISRSLLEPVEQSKGFALHKYVRNQSIRRTLRSEFRLPTNRTTKAYRSFAIWSITNIVLTVNILLFTYGVSYDYKYWVLVHHALLLSNIIWLIIAFINHAEEKYTFLAKLVGVFLCLTLFLLGMIGFLFFSPEFSAGVSKLYAAKKYTDLINEQQQNNLTILAILIPLITILIIVIIPFFFRYNLLRPLSYVLKGIKRVNEGDLSKDVHIEGNDEIGYLSESFNRMIDSLRRYSNQMEGLVTQRTKELYQQKEELQKTLENLQSTQAQLIQSEKMASLGELTAGIAHEIQNPLNFVNNFSEVNKELIAEMKEEIEKGNYEEVKTLAKDVEDNEEKINHHGKRADAIVKGMLLHSQTSKGQKELTDINALANEYLRLSYQGHRAKDKSFNAEIKTDFDESIGNISIIPQDIGRVLLNLYNNAFYTVTEKNASASTAGQPYEPTVSISTKKAGDKVLILVKDNGNGIPQKVLDKIFQPFFTTKPTGQGTGLGLSLAYDIIKAHGGEIKVESKEGDGAEFVIELNKAS